MKSDQLNIEDSMKIISEMVNNTKYNIGEDKIIYLMWGYAVTISALVHYVLQFQFEISNAWMVWFSMPIAGIVNGIYFSRKKKDTSRPMSFTDRALSSLWSTFIIALIAVLFSAPAVGWNGVYPFLMILYGIGTAATGGIIKFNALRIGGYISILLGLFAFYLEFEYQLFLIALSVIACYIIPGHLLPDSSK